MNIRTRDRMLTWALPVMLACVLIALAILQYRWSKQISEAATTRIQTNLQDSMMNFRQDLARELSSLCLDLQGDPSTSSVDARSLAQRLVLWERTSATRSLIVNVYEFDRRGDPEGPLLHLLPAESRFEKIDWPARFHHVRSLLTVAQPDGSVPPGQAPSADSSHRTGEPRQPSSATSGGEESQMIGAIDQSIPVLIVPATRGAQQAWLLVELDTQVLEQSVFPQLSQRYFGDPHTSEYEVAVTANHDSRRQVFFSSADGFGRGDKISADAVLNLFGPPGNQGGPLRPPLELFRARRIDPQSKPESTAPSSNTSAGTFAAIRFDPIDTGEGGWNIAVRHRKGSVAAAVAELRLRNLEISFGVLLVLGASMTLIIFASQRARRLAMLQMDFVAGVSHELRTPVAAILSISENIADGVVDNRDQLLRYGGLIRSQARQLNHLVEQVLRFAAMQRKATSYTIRRFRIPDVIDEVLESTGNLITASGTKVEKQIEPDLPPVDADFGVLSQCLQNLITNAVKYGGENKWIGIQAASRPIGSSREVTITVQDHGIGISSDELGHIFEPFYRSPKVVESQVHGTGLGLALAKSFAEAMGGRLTVASESGKGSSFTIHLPVASGPEVITTSPTKQ